MAEESCAHPDCGCALEKGQGVSRDGENFAASTVQLPAAIEFR